MLLFLVYAYTYSSMCIVESKRAKKRLTLAKLKLFVDSHDLQISYQYFGAMALG